MSTSFTAKMVLGLALLVTGTRPAAAQEAGFVVAWGDNSQGQCTVPTQNADLVNMFAGAMHCMGLRGDGSLMPWG